MTSNPLFSLLLIPCLIFLSRVVDVTIGTMRIIYVTRGLKPLAALTAFFEVLVWLFALSQIMRNLTSVAHYVAYAAGFAVGNLVGITIEGRIAIGTQIVRIITRRDARALVDRLRESGYGVTSVNAEGETGPLKLVFTVIKRRRLARVVDIIRKVSPQAFYTVEDVRFAADPVVEVGEALLGLQVQRQGK